MMEDTPKDKIIREDNYNRKRVKIVVTEYDTRSQPDKYFKRKVARS